MLADELIHYKIKLCILIRVFKLKYILSYKPTILQFFAEIRLIVW